MSCREAQVVTRKGRSLKPGTCSHSLQGSERLRTNLQRTAILPINKGYEPPVTTVIRSGRQTKSRTFPGTFK